MSTCRENVACFQSTESMDSSNLEERKVVALIRKPIYPDWEERLKCTFRHAVYQLWFGSKEEAPYFLKVNKSIKLRKEHHTQDAFHTPHLFPTVLQPGMPRSRCGRVTFLRPLIDLKCCLLCGLLPVSVPLCLLLLLVMESHHEDII